MVLNKLPSYTFFFCLMLYGTACAANMDKLTSFDKTSYHLFHSKLIKHDYHVYVKTPLITEQNKDKVFPTVYLLDGGITFPLLTGYTRYLNLAEEIPDVVLVGISYGTEDWKKGNRRSTDFTAPAKQREHYGGAENFQKMLSSELFPMIEKNYPSDKDKRILFGQSMGGQFAIYNAMFHPENFWGIIASNPAIHRNLVFFTNTYKTTTKQVKLYISRARNDDVRFIKPLEKWLSYWNKHKHPWSIKTQWLNNHNHFSAAPDAFRNGIKWLLNPKEVKTVQ